MRSMTAFLLLLLAATMAQAAQVPLPRPKPAIAMPAAKEPAVEAPPEGAKGSGAGPADAGEDKPAGASRPDARDLPSCLRRLATNGILASPAADLAAAGRCRVEDAVALEAVATRLGIIDVPSSAVLNCHFAINLAGWLKEVVNPVAVAVLGSPVDAILTGPGHQCRRRAGGKLSEHAQGNAIDITGVRLADGRRIPIATLTDAAGAERAFLRAISTSACGYFTTVLGPGSDGDHSDHLHVDLARRRLAEFRICMAR